jgi:hypothetical protein
MKFLKFVLAALVTIQATSAAAATTSDDNPKRNLQDQLGVGADESNTYEATTTTNFNTIVQSKSDTKKPRKMTSQKLHNVGESRIAGSTAAAPSEDPYNCYASMMWNGVHVIYDPRYPIGVDSDAWNTKPTRTTAESV